MPLQHHKNKHPFFTKLFVGLLFIGLSGNSIALGRQIKKDNVNAQTFDIANKIKALEKSHQDTLISKIQGKVLDGQTKKFIAGATVLLKGTIIAISTDAEGNFNLVIPDSLLRQKIVLVVSTVGYAAKEFSIKRENLQSGDLNIIKLTKNKR